jgi:hypothetical protein
MININESNQKLIHIKYIIDYLLSLFEYTIYF